MIVRLAAAFVLTLGLAAQAAALTADEVNSASYAALERGVSKKISPMVVKAQALLDRRGVSPGVIDGHDGDNFRKAIAQFKRLEGIGEDDELDEDTWRRLGGAEPQEIVVPYRVTKEDAATEFVKRIPTDYAEQAKMKQLGFTTAREMFSERFHMDEDLLAALNPKAPFEEEGTELAVVAVERPKPPAAKWLEADKGRGLLIVRGENDEMLASFPATIGSEQTPTPSGELKITRLARNPTYHYDPDKNFQQGKNTEKLTLPPGPNNPVGSTWIALSKPTFGIHGAPEPSKIGKTASHGCVRLTNWDAAWLAQMVKTGMLVRFID